MEVERKIVRPSQLASHQAKFGCSVEGWGELYQAQSLQKGGVQNAVDASRDVAQSDLVC